MDDYLSAPSLDDKYTEALYLLREVKEYLGRLPRNHYTTQQATRIDAFLNSPGSRILQAKLDERQRTQQRDLGLEGMACFTPAGIPQVAARLSRVNMLEIVFPLLRMNAPANSLFSQGVQIKLAPPSKFVKRDLFASH